jgi:hypothetical protein
MPTLWHRHYSSWFYFDTRRLPIRGIDAHRQAATTPQLTGVLQYWVACFMQGPLACTVTALPPGALHCKARVYPL